MKSVIFNTQEVIATLEGRKSQFRKCFEPPFANVARIIPTKHDSGNFIFMTQTGLYYNKKCPFGKVGDKIFVKEPFNIFVGNIQYKAAITGNERYFWKPARSMKQHQSRLTLRITDISVERLQDISEGDAIADGQVFKSENYWHSTLHPTKGTYQCWTSAKEAFGKLWNSTHKKPSEKWEVNPFVFVINFEVVK